MTEAAIPPTIAAQYGRAATKRRNSMAYSQRLPSGATEPTSTTQTLGFGSVNWQQHPIYKNDFNTPRRTVTRFQNPEVPVNPFESIHVQDRQGSHYFLSGHTS